MEPGRFYRGFRSYPGNQGSVCQKTPLKKFIIVDAGMNDLIRPSLYGAYHEIVPLSGNMRASEKADVVGPICESADFLAKGRVLPRVRANEYLAVMCAGAYGFSMSSNYNSRCRPAEIMVKRQKIALIRRRETFQDLIRNEIIPRNFKEL